MPKTGGTFVIGMVDAAPALSFEPHFRKPDASDRNSESAGDNSNLIYFCVVRD
jgi:hypothetical protein